MISLELFICDLLVDAQFPFYLLFLASSTFFSYKFTKNYITMKVLHQIIIFCLLFNIIEKMLKPVLYILLSLKLYFIFITIMAHTNTYFNLVRSKSQGIANKRNGEINFNKKLMMTITYTFICLLLFSLSPFVMFIGFFIQMQDEKIMRNLHYWINTLPYSNSYANAFIIPYHYHENHKIMT